MQRTYAIHDARGTGGKAGKGRNKTSTVQVYDDTDTWNAMLKKSFRFTVGDEESYKKAWVKARSYVDSLKVIEQAEG